MNSLNTKVFSVLLGLALLPVAAGAEDKEASAGKLLTADGSVLTRPALDKPWQVLRKGQAVPTGATLVGLPGAAVAGGNGAVRLDLLSDLDELSPYPVIESAVVLHPAGAFDLDFTLDRGRIDLVNTRDKGQAKVRVHFRKQAWDLTLAGPGTRVALEIYSRRPPGSRFNPRTGPDADPVTSLVLLVLRGEVTRECPTCRQALAAPPGPALYEWDSIFGQDVAVKKLNELPPWAKAPDRETPRSRKKKEAIEKFRQAAVATSVDEALKRFLYSDDPVERRVGVYASAALDRLDYVGEVLSKSKHPDTWHNAVVALRHWLGRKPGQDRRLYERLTTVRKFSPAEARTTLELLYGFSAKELARPELYQALIELLRNDQLALRGLAQWHLKRLAPAVRTSFDPAGPKEEWEKAYREWKKAIPRGKLPPEPAAEGKKDK